MTTPYYRAWGPVRGDCGHRHQTAEAAQRCVDRDHASIRRAYPSTYPTRTYSDRDVQRMDADGYPTVMCSCAGCGYTLIEAEAIYHGGQPFCKICDEAPRDDE